MRNIFRKNNKEIDPDEIFIDSSNLPQFDTYQFEGRIERPIAARTIIFLSVIFIIFAVGFSSRLWLIQVSRGEAYAKESEENRLRYTDIFSNRGVIFDRNGVILASNSENKDGDFPLRNYAAISGMAHVVGYLKYPTKDAYGFYYRKSFEGKEGVEATMNDDLSGQNGLKIVETDATGKIQSESTSRLPQDGNNITLSIDSRIQSKLYDTIAAVAVEHHYTGGAGLIMNVHTGEIISMVSYPEYNQTKMTDGDSAAFKAYLNDPQNVFLNRAISGLYAPGSIVKPIVALAALQEGIISPDKQILSTGSLSLPNPYYPGKFSVFKDWKAHGWVDMRHALAVSSDVYFYEVGGGFEDQKGLGISKIEKYFKMFGLDQKTGISLHGEQQGIIPSPEWKAKVFNGDPWRIGDTYITAIGQYGVQITPIAIVRYIASIANNGTLHTPTLIKGEKDKNEVKVSFSPEYFKIIKEGMRLSVTDGVAAGLNIPNFPVAAKTGTAEIGALKNFINSSCVGFFPYDNPNYAFAIFMEHGPRDYSVGATYVIRQVVDWMLANAPEYTSTN